MGHSSGAGVGCSDAGPLLWDAVTQASGVGRSCGAAFISMLLPSFSAVRGEVEGGNSMARQNRAACLDSRSFCDKSS